MYLHSGILPLVVEILGMNLGSVLLITGALRAL
jgi:hypothetical protein